MVQPDSTSDTSVPPKRLAQRIFKKIRRVGRKPILAIALPLILINAGIAHMVINQLVITASATATPQVKDDITTLTPAGEVGDKNSVEQTLPDDEQGIITTYTVKSGDTLSAIAQKFNISTNTIRWANDLTEKTSKIKVGDELIILPVSGIEYTIKKGDTLSGIATTYDVSQADILAYNDIEASAIKIGAQIIIPNAEPLDRPAPVKSIPKDTSISTPVTTAPAPKPTPNVSDAPKAQSLFSNPIPGGVFSQGLHDGNAVDFAAPIGTTVEASATGTVIIAKDSGYNGGYGKYIVINHANGAQTLYGHLSQVKVVVGDKVNQGQAIALSGNSGKSTGAHLHYKEMGTGKINTFAYLKKGTHV